ncbi:MAG: transcription-repair coupling factor [Bacillota bacterium]
MKAFLLAGLDRFLARPLLIITPSTETGHKLMSDCQGFLTAERTLFFPDEELLSFEVTARSPELAAQRLQVLERMPQGDFGVIVAPVRALLRRLIPLEDWQRSHWLIKVGEQLSLKEFLEFMVQVGYERAELVEAPGQFSTRGGIIDFFPLTEPNPFRIELFDDEIESIRQFDPLSQRSQEIRQQIMVGPAREVIANATVAKKGIQRLEKAITSVIERLAKEGKTKASREVRSRLETWRERIDVGGLSEGMEALVSFLYPQATTLLDYLPDQALVILDEPQLIQQELEGCQQEFLQLGASLLEDGKFFPGQENNLVTRDFLSSQLAARQTLALSLLPLRGLPWHLNNSLSLSGRTVPRFMGQVDSATAELRQWQKARNLVAIIVSDIKQGEQLRQALLDYNIIAIVNPTDQLAAGQVIILPGELTNGFELTQGHLVVITETDLFGQSRRPQTAKRRSKTRGNQLETFTDLKAGDYVVHATHGIGRYKGVERLTVAGVQKDYLLIQYAGEDRLYVPTDQVQLLQKYIGAEGHAPKLNKIGGSEWNRVKARVKQSVKDIAQELIELYAARESSPGYAFSPDTVWQHEFEAAFPYEETADQLQSLEEIKQDMSSPKPMDRLLCGDVGYGKTEVALRAAFKAVMDSKQVAVLVPTTVLAQQHYHTFQERLKGYPVTVEVISRFKTAREQKQILARTALGQVDILIGTHRMLSGDVSFRDLGLLIVDEEQRFGVAHKERLKQLRQNVDVLTLTATPIPRTLHMALAGARDMSLIETPPEDRYPVQTYVVEYSPELVREAIRRELRRGGQVFYVHNRIYDLRAVARQVQELVPEARIAIAHGQMKEDHLEKVMVGFVEGDYDVLVSTSIVESGLDIPNVNTLIVQNADHLGLAQLYQLRGRVGRSNRLAYAYLTYRKDKVLTEAAAKRLQAIREFTEFGSGFKIALRDLEIRGAGNLLGAEQHGHMAAVGFDMYCRLLEESIQEIRNGPKVERPALPVVELPVDTYIPDEYLSDPRLKVEIYKKLAGAHTLEDLDEVEAEIRDRFGQLPEALENLIGITRLRLLAHQAQVGSLQQQGEQLRVRFNRPFIWPADNLARLTRRLGKQARAITLLDGGDFLIRTRALDSGELVAVLEALLREAGAATGTVLVAGKSG